MDKEISIKLYEEAKYKMLIEEMNGFNYFISGSDDPLIRILSPTTKNEPFLFATSITACFAAQVVCECFSMSKGAEIIVHRMFRFDEKDRHYNAYDSIIFSTVKGNVIKLTRKSAPDHVKDKTQYNGIEDIKEVYSLPKKEVGPVEEYGKEGAFMPIKFHCLSDEVYELINIAEED